MTEPLAREIAEQVVAHGIVSNWQFYLLFTCLAFVGSALAAVISGYLRRRAENLATKADLDNVLEQLRLSTETTEKIRAEVGEAAWIGREWRTVRRQKLEDLVDVATSSIQWFESRRLDVLRGESFDASRNPIDRAVNLGALYFPELEHEVLTLEHVGVAALGWIAETSAAASKLTNPDEKQAMLTKQLEKSTDLHLNLMQAASSLRKSSSKLIREAMGA